MRHGRGLKKECEVRGEYDQIILHIYYNETYFYNQYMLIGYF